MDCSSGRFGFRGIHFPEHAVDTSIRKPHPHCITLKTAQETAEVVSWKIKSATEVSETLPGKPSRQWPKLTGQYLSIYPSTYIY